MADQTKRLRPPTLTASALAKRIRAKLKARVAEAQARAAERRKVEGEACRKEEEETAARAVTPETKEHYGK